MALEKWSTTAGNNVIANTGINWDEGQAPSTVNDSARSTMGELRDWYENAEWPIFGRNGGSAYSISFVSATVFKFAGTDRRTLVPIGRRVKAGVGAGIIYGSCTDVTLSASDTQATVAWDSGQLDSSLSYVALGVLNSANNSFPRNMNMSFSDIALAGLTATRGVATSSTKQLVSLDAPAQTFLQSDVNLNNTSNYFNICNTGAIGASGQVWKISACLSALDTAGAAVILGRIWDGSSTVYVETPALLASASSTGGVTIPLSAIVTLSGATTFHLSAKDTTSTSGIAKTTGAAGTANKATWILAERIS